MGPKAGLDSQAVRQNTPMNVLASAIITFALASSYPNLKTFPTACKPLTYQASGTGKPIVLLAGGPGMNPAYVMPVAQMLAAAGRRVLLFHQRGTGASAGAISCRDRMTVAGAVADLEDLRSSLQLEKLTIAGHSWGGMLAMAYAQSHPNRVAGLLLLDTGPLGPSAFPIENAAVNARLSPEDRTALHNAKSVADIDLLERKAVFADPAKASLIDQSIPAGEPLWYESVSKLIGPDLGHFDVNRGMRQLNAPVMLIFGRLDPGFFIAQQVEELQHNAKLIVIEHAGHYPWLEDPVRTAAALKATAVALP
jgi:proline iminopeptidase